MAFIGFLVFWAISFVAGQLLRAVTAKPPNASPDTPERPRTEEGGQIPAVFGTVKLGPTILWFGDVEAIPVKKRVQTSLFTSKKQTIAYKYLVGMQGGLCWGPVDELVDIIVADKKKLSEVAPLDWRAELFGSVIEITAVGVSPALPESYAAAGTALTIEAPFLFGGPEKGGGLDGTLRFYFGSLTQGENAYLAGQPDLPDDFPHYKGLCYAVWEQVDCGQSPRIEPWQFVVRRCPTTLGTLASDVTLSRIGDDANPAEIIYELWTDTRWGLGESSSALDTASFLAALQTLSDEGLGISGTFVGGESADEKVKEILRTIDGVLVADPLTGKLKLTLIRADYTVADLETFTPSNSRDLTVSRPDWDELTTEVKVRYTDAGQDFTTRARPAYNPAVRAALGKARGVTIDYPLISTGTNAEALAVRDLKSLSSTLATGTITLPRVAATLAPGDPFILNYPDEGLNATVVRATRINYGTINGESAIEANWAEDVFGVSGGVFTVDPPAVWTPPTPPSFGNVVVIPTVTTSATQTCVTLDITGQVSLIGTIEMRGQKGGEVAGAWTTFAIDDPPTLCVDRDELLEGVIAWRVTITDPDATEDTIEDEVPVPPLGVDDGTVEGTPGNLRITFHAGPPRVFRSVGAALDEPEGAVMMRKSENTGAIRRARLQHASHTAPGGSAELHLLYSLDRFATPGLETGVFVRADRERFPEVGDYLPIDEAAIGDNVMLGIGTKGGDGDTVIKTGNIYLDAVSSDTPPEQPPEIDTDLPQGGPLGNLILDLDAEGDLMAALAYANGASVTSWPDETAITGDAAPYTTGGTQTAPTFQTSGFAGGAKPCVRADSGVEGVAFPVPTTGHCTFICVVDVTSGSGAPTDGQNPTGGFVITTASINNANGWLQVRADGTLFAGCNAGSFGTPSKGGPTDITDGPHILRFALDKSAGRFKVYIDGVLDIDYGPDPNVFGSWVGVARMYLGNVLSQGAVVLDYGRVVCYDAPQTMTGLNAAELVLQAQWGTP